jgi:hypothetical protein
VTENERINTECEAVTVVFLAALPSSTLPVMSPFFRYIRDASLTVIFKTHTEIYQLGLLKFP